MCRSSIATWDFSTSHPNAVHSFSEADSLHDCQTCKKATWPTASGSPSLLHGLRARMPEIHILWITRFDSWMSVSSPETGIWGKLCNFYQWRSKQKQAWYPQGWPACTAVFENQHHNITPSMERYLTTISIKGNYSTGKERNAKQRLKKRKKRRRCQWWRVLLLLVGLLGIALQQLELHKHKHSICFICHKQKMTLSMILI